MKAEASGQWVEAYQRGEEVESKQRWICKNGGLKSNILREGSRDFQKKIVLDGERVLDLSWVEGESHGKAGIELGVESDQAQEQKRWLAPARRHLEW